jgi:hypothetical protein
VSLSTSSSPGWSSDELESTAHGVQLHGDTRIPTFAGSMRRPTAALKSTAAIGPGPDQASVPPRAGHRGSAAGIATSHGVASAYGS